MRRPSSASRRAHRRDSLELVESSNERPPAFRPPRPISHPEKHLGINCVTKEDAAEYRREAAECRKQAEQALHPYIKEQWLKLANNWSLMADRATRKSKSRPPPTEPD